MTVVAPTRPPPPNPGRSTTPSHPETTKKSSWPELVGNLATLAVQQIAHERPDVAVEVLPVGSYMLPGYNAHRVRVHINAQDLVSEVPQIG